MFTDISASKLARGGTEAIGNVAEETLKNIRATANQGLESTYARISASASLPRGISSGKYNV